MATPEPALEALLAVVAVAVGVIEPVIESAIEPPIEAAEPAESIEAAEPVESIKPIEPLPFAHVVPVALPVLLEVVIAEPVVEPRAAPKNALPPVGVPLAPVVDHVAAAGPVPVHVPVEEDPTAVRVASAHVVDVSAEMVARKTV